MSLSSLYLDAFIEVAKLKSFSKAAAKLNVTQSALSQRVINLENELGSSLFVRDSTGVRLTDLGQRLLRYCHSKTLLEDEFMVSLRAKDGLSGIVRVAGFSTVNRSVLMPILGGFLKKHPKVSLELRTEELRDLPGRLISGASDFIVANHPLGKQGIENHLLGYEEMVLVQSTSKTSRDDVYLDHDEEDMTTIEYFQTQGQGRKLPQLKRSFLGDIYGLIEGVRLGMGRAVVPMHLVRDVKGLEVVKGFAPMKVPVYLTYYGQPFFTALQTEVIDLLREETAAYLG